MTGTGFFGGSLAEPMSCIVGGYHAQYHTIQGSYEHKMGIVEGGKMAILAGVGPMGLGAIDYALHGPIKPSLLVVTDISQERLDRAASIFTKEDAAKNGVQLIYKNTAEGDPGCGADGAQQWHRLRRRICICACKISCRAGRPHFRQ